MSKIPHYLLSNTIFGLDLRLSISICDLKEGISAYTCMKPLE